MSKPITIRIKKHTKVRRPMSKYILDYLPEFGGYWNNGVRPEVDPLVQDIKTGLDNPLRCMIPIEDVGWTLDISQDKHYYADPSLLTKLKNKLRRK